MTEKMPIKVAKKKFIKRSFYCGVVAILVCWFMKLFGFDYFGLDLDNKFFNDLDNFLGNHYLIKQLYCTFMLTLQLYWMTCIVQKEQGVKTLLYVIYLIPVTIIIRVLTSYGNILYNLRQIVEILYLILACSKFKFKKLLSGVGCILLITLYQLLSLQTRSLSFKTHENGFMVTQILTIDFYLLLYISKEVAIMDDSTWIFFGFTAWLYRIAGFIVGLFTLHPIKKSREWYEKGKAKEDARKAKKATR